MVYIITYIWHIWTKRRGDPFWSARTIGTAAAGRPQGLAPTYMIRKEIYLINQYPALDQILHLNFRGWASNSRLYLNNTRLQRSTIRRKETHNNPPTESLEHIEPSPLPFDKKADTVYYGITPFGEIFDEFLD